MPAKLFPRRVLAETGHENDDPSPFRTNFETRLSLLTRIAKPGPVDQLAWEEFVDQYGPMIYHWCRRWGLQDADAKDVTQQVLLTLPAKMAGSSTTRMVAFAPGCIRWRTTPGTISATARVAPRFRAAMVRPLIRCAAAQRHDGGAGDYGYFILEGEIFHYWDTMGAGDGAVGAVRKRRVITS